MVKSAKKRWSSLVIPCHEILSMISIIQPTFDHGAWQNYENTIRILSKYYDNAVGVLSYYHRHFVCMIMLMTHELEHNPHDYGHPRLISCDIYLLGWNSTNHKHKGADCVVRPQLRPVMANTTRSRRVGRRPRRPDPAASVTFCIVLWVARRYPFGP